MTEDTQEQLKEQHKQFRAKTFRFVLELIVIFGGPALLALIGGQYLDGMYNSGKTITFISLGAAFVFSWIITIWRTRRLGEEFAKTEEKLQENKKSEISQPDT